VIDRRTIAFAGGGLVVAGVALVPLVATAANTEPDSDPSMQESSSETETVTVVRGDLTETSEANGVVGFGRATVLPIEATGLVTQTPESGDFVAVGQELLRVADQPVVLASGSQPLYRELRRVRGGERDEAGDRVGPQTGLDVEQLQAFLVNAGFDAKGRLEIDGEFGLSTERAVEDWQRSVGHPATGRVDRSQLVFVDGPVRIETAPFVGESFVSITVTADTPVVSFSVTSKQRTFFEVGAPVGLESASVSATGFVTEAKRAVSDDGSTRYDVTVELDAGADLGDAETANVTSSRTIAAGVLTVPVRALIALAEGGWAVQVDGPSGATLTAVELGDVVNGIAEISGVDEGTELVVPV